MLTFPGIISNLLLRFLSTGTYLLKNKLHVCLTVPTYFRNDTRTSVMFWSAVIYPTYTCYVITWVWPLNDVTWRCPPLSQLLQLQDGYQIGDSNSLKNFLLNIKLITISHLYVFSSSFVFLRWGVWLTSIRFVNVLWYLLFLLSSQYDRMFKNSFIFNNVIAY